MNRNWTILCLVLLITGTIISGKGTCVSGREKTDTGSSSFRMVSPPNDATNISYKTPTFTWTDMDSERNYILQIDNESNFATPVYVNEGIGADATSFTLPLGRLSRNAPYWWRIIAIDLHTTAQIMASNAPFKFTTAEFLDTPEAFDLVSPGNTEVVFGLTPILSWNTPETAKTFTLEIDEQNNFAAPLVYTTSITTTGGTSATAFTVPTGVLEIYKTYYWRVTAVNDMGQTPATDVPWSFYTMGSKPGDFALLTPTHNSIQYTLTPAFYWGESSDTQSYALEISITDTFTTPVTYTVSYNGPITSTVAFRGLPLASGTVSYTLPSSVLDIRQLYYWRVAAINNSEPSGVYGNILVATGVTATRGAFTTFIPGVPPDPFDLVEPSPPGITDVLQTQVFKWSNSIGQLSYTLQIDNNSDFSSPEHQDRNIPPDMVDTTLRPITSGILMAGVLYYWRVIAVNSYGQTTSPLTGTPAAPWSFRIRPWAEDTPTTIEQVFPSRAGHTATWTGTEMIIWGGHDETDHYNSGWRYNPSNGEWVDIALTDAPVSRAYHTAVWDATRGNMLIWGGWDGAKTLNTGAILNLEFNTWVPITTTSAPASRTSHTAIWISSRNEMIVWGGGWLGVEYFNDGFKYSYAISDWATAPISITDTWSVINPDTFNYLGSALSGRIGHTAVWGYDDGGADPYVPLPPAGLTATPASPGRNDAWEMYIFGGYNGAWYLNDSARYSPIYNNWKRITVNSPCPSSRYKHTAVWSGAEMIVWGGQYGGTYLNNGSRFYPGRPPYSDYGAWSDVIGYGYAYNPYGGWAYTSQYSSINGWTSLNAMNTPSPRSGHTAVMASSPGYMLVWAGRDASTYLNSGGMYNIYSDTWTPISNVNAPRGREEHTAVWTGTEMIAWGGKNDTTYFNDGGKFNPTTNTWTPIAPPTSVGITARQRHTSVWTGTEMVMWGGDAGITNTSRSGARYSPTANKWFGMSLANAPTVRTQHTAIYAPIGVTWTFNSMIVWGGYTGSNAWLNTGAVYNLTSNIWLAITIGLANTPIARAGHTAIWDPLNEQMIVWGGANGSNYLSTGGRYNPAGPSWTPTTPTGAPAGRSVHTAVWDTENNQMIVWGGLTEDPPGTTIRYQTGYRYNPAPPGEVTDSWALVAPTDAVSRSGHSAVWAPGVGMLIWGGESANNITLNTGRIYSPTVNSWASITTTNAPSGRAFHTAIWSAGGLGTPEMVIFGGWNGIVYLKDGGRYNPLTDRWYTSPNGVPGFDITTTAPRAYHSVIWVGSLNQMIIWGGAIFGGYTNTGIRFVPLAD